MVGLVSVLFCRKFLLVLQISPSNTQYMAGMNKSTQHILIRAPLAIRRHRALIISIYMPTPKVAAKNPMADIIIERMLVLWAMEMASALLFPEPRSFS